ncbi:MAG TPA: C40 family peptidase [Anaerovoracaceae bacterium]|nr:C40 family peptidase [Anaerovoracaceae bacterium]
MIRISLKSKVNLLILLIAVFQLFYASCSKHLYPDPSYKNIESRDEKKKMDDFMHVGTGKALDTHSTTPDEIIKTARQYLGVPHCMGGTTKKCMDCSGLLATVFASHGIKLPHNSEEQARYGKIITGMENLKKGDLVFFIRSYRTSKFITHSGIYIGNNRFIHTSSSDGVTITSLNDPWWNQRYLFGTRVFR